MSDVSESFSIIDTNLEDVVFIDSNKNEYNEVWFEGGSCLDELEGYFFKIKIENNQLNISINSDDAQMIDDPDIVLGEVFETIINNYNRIPNMPLFWSNNNFDSMPGSDIYLAKKKPNNKPKL